jgi:hypothetical protein
MEEEFLSMRFVRLLMIAMLLMSTATVFAQPRSTRNAGSSLTAKIARFVIRTLGRLSPPVGEPGADDPGPGLAAPGTPAVTTP